MSTIRDGAVAAAAGRSSSSHADPPQRLDVLSRRHGFRAPLLSAERLNAALVLGRAFDARPPSFDTTVTA
jgi:hypothetical protein